MTIRDNNYPTKKDLEPKVPKKGKPAGPTDELPLSDPADSNFSHAVHEPADTAGDEQLVADGQPAAAAARHNEQAHKQWNDSKPNT